MELKCTVLYVLFLVLCSSCKENNVCPTIKDYYTLKDNPNCWYDIAAEAEVSDVINYYGYPVEKHEVVTPDGYILTMFRIPQRYSSKNPVKEGGPVFLQHGWLASSANFVALGNQSLAFLLAKEGYDVWLGNFRGTEYSEGHVNLTTANAQYWQYSVDHLALYDIPTQLEYIAQTTVQRGNIVYIGHSLGTTVAFMYSSALPEEARQLVKVFIFLAPAAEFANTKSIFLRSLPIVMDTVENIIDDNDLIRLTSQAKSTRALVRHICLESPLLMERCFQVVRLMLHGPMHQMAESTFPVIRNQEPAGSSVKITRHIAGLVKYGLSRYDYGLQNEEVYGSRIPPSYDVSKISVPVLMFASTDDWLTTIKDALITYRRLSPIAKIHGIRVISKRNFNHEDFIAGKHAKSIIYDPIISFLELLFS